jgi:DNA polymerase-1
MKAAGMRSSMVLQIHDELVFDAPVEEVDELKAIIEREMTTAIDFGVPLEVGIGVAANWLDAH